MKIVIAGGTGFIGTELIKSLLEAKHSVVLLTRRPSGIPDGLRGHQSSTLSIEVWDGETNGKWQDSIDGADAVINLAGEPIAGKRWTTQQKTRLINSRLNATKIIVEAVGHAKKKPGVLINASAVGYYGGVETGEVTEAASSGNDFLAGLCRQWESEARKVEAYGVRLVLLRTGIALEKHGGALEKMLLPFKLFAGGPMGNGRQWMPWIHLEDEIRIVLFALEEQSLSGPVNVSAPTPVTMKEFATTLGRTIDRPSWAPVPGFVLKIALGEMAGILLTGQKAVPEKLLQHGFTFRYPTLDLALSEIFNK
jgi:uncharacterized protein (TIGR01777 family)